MTLGDHPNVPWLQPSKPTDNANWSWKIAAVEDLTKGEVEEYPDPKCCDLPSSTQRVMKVRRDLGELADWPGPASAEAVSLARAIEETMDTLFSDDSIDSFTWSLGAHAKGRWGCTPHLAAATGHESAVELLFEMGAEIEAKDSSTRTPLH